MACSRPLDPKSTRGRKGAVAGLACARAARAGRAGRMACAWPRGASLGGGRVGIGSWRWIWTALACPRNVGEGLGAGQAAERVARTDARQLGGVCVAAGFGPALGFVCMHVQRGVLVRVCAGCGMLQDVGKRAQAMTHDHIQACFSRVIMCTFISLQSLPAPLAGLRAFLSLSDMSLSRCTVCFCAAAMLVTLPLLCWHTPCARA